MILYAVNQHIDQGPNEKDLLQMILEGPYQTKVSSNHMISRDKFIVDNCKNIYFAGHETTVITASWSLMLLAPYPEWQARVRAEVLNVCKEGLPVDTDMLQNMKTLTMVIQETLRLYPPAVFPQAYMPFGVGPRTCLGKHFAMIELKVLLSFVLSKFRFSLSPNYHHSTAFRLVVKPANGVCLSVKPQ